MSQITQTGDTWKLSGHVGVGSVSALLKSSETFSLNANTVIDFADVSAIDTAAISLILEWKRRAKQAQQGIKLVNLPDNLKSLADVYGVWPLLN